MPIRIPFFIAGLFFLLAVISVQWDDITVDEPDHLQYGASVLQLKTGRVVEGRDFNTTMPVTALNALPRAIEQLIHPGLQKNDWGESDIKNGRYISILVSLVLLFYIFYFAKAIGGFAAGCWAMFLAALDPNLLAHGRLVTTDIYSALAFVMTLYHLYEWLINKKEKHFYAWCFAIAFAQCCKVNNILLYPLCLAAILAWRHQKLKKEDGKRILIFIVVQLLVINLAFLFYQTGLSLSGYQFKSAFFQQWQNGFLGQIPLPFPKPYIDTFDLVQYERETFDGISNNYLWGELRYKEGFLSYYLICGLLKTPVLTQLLIAASMVVLLVKRAFRKRVLFFFLIPAAVVLLLISTSSVQSGYRYLLPILSLAFVLCGTFIALQFERWNKMFRLVFLLLPLIVAATAFPNFIAYTNLLVFDKKNAWRYLADSNLNWGQRQKKVEQFLAEHPSYIFEPGKPTKGTIVVEINNLVGLYDPAKFEWLRVNYKPIATFDDCYLIYEVTD